MFTKNIPSFSYQLYPLPTPKIAATLISLTGQKYLYQNGPQEWMTFSWPGSGSEQKTYLELETINGANIRSYEREGIWGIFHLLQKAKITHYYSSNYKIQWLIKNRHFRYPITFKLHCNSNLNIFALILNNKLLLPLSLLQS